MNMATCAPRTVWIKATSYRVHHMFFFSWFSGKSRRAKHVSSQRNRQPAPQPQMRPSGKEDQESQGKKPHKVAREQLYEAIRESMTRLGILSASYKFKVLDRDQRDSNYLVMMDLTRVAGSDMPSPGEMETLITQNAMLRYKITVSAVYWRLTEVPAPSKLTATQPAAPVHAAQKPGVSHEPIHADEVAAFQRALLAASVHSTPISVEPKKKNRRAAAPSSRQDFEDTEVFEAMTYPALSTTQYGELH